MNRYDYALGKKKPPKDAPEKGKPTMEDVPNATRAVSDGSRRHITRGAVGDRLAPIRIVWADGIDEAEIENLREQVDLALNDPNYTIVANYQIHWEEYEPMRARLDPSASEPPPEDAR